MKHVSGRMGAKILHYWEVGGCEIIVEADYPWMATVRADPHRWGIVIWLYWVVLASFSNGMDALWGRIKTTTRRVIGR